MPITATEVQRQRLDELYEKYSVREFIPDDPVSVPHLFTKKEDIEIAGFFASVIAWGNRKSIIRSAKQIIELMDNAPHDFTLHHHENDLKPMERFAHRTFNGDDLLGFISCLREIYSREGLESLFATDSSHEANLRQFHSRFFCAQILERSRKHIARVDRGSAAKRLNMFLRWMVRKDRNGIDFGLWKSISPAHLFIPLDVHSAHAARSLGLLSRKQDDWRAVVELTENLRQFDASDPVKYDYALFGPGVNKHHVI